MTLVQEVNIIEAVGLLHFTTNTFLVPCFSHKAKQQETNWDIWFKFNSGGWRKRPMPFLSLQIQWANIRTKKELATLTEAAGQTPLCRFYKCNRAACLQICQGQYTGIWSGIWRAVLQPQHYPHYCLLKYLQELCPAAATSAHRANKLFPAIPWDKQGLSHSLPLHAMNQRTEAWSLCAFGSVSFFPASVWQV